ncbi:pentatricopeptide repeat-containing protein At2g01510, mitochondrial-like [Magnolia sinica]|uniref:pentatricopeptide repeat-containing protein At2g01510, mitochondrial-like n=1 Tax=Magnolia sinica TaxID=86752 RepID=UPI00265970FA|nr:pentatricopeptide repeat-containing protein At2g01510, mitochondrial-like [Magnolia sinica]
MISTQLLQPALPLLQLPKTPYPSHPWLPYPSHPNHHPYKRPLTIKHALETREKELPSTSAEFSLLLQSCIESRSLQQGQNLHSQIRRLGFERNRDLLPKLLKLYSVCGRVEDARNLFDRIPKRSLNVFAWTSLISGYIENGLPKNAIRLFYEMLGFGVRPDGFTFSALLKACGCLGFLELAIQLHSMILKFGCSLSVENSLIHVYGSLGEFEFARRVFDEMPHRDVVSWTSMIRACSSSEKYTESMQLFHRMQLDGGLKPNEVTVVSVLPACGFFSSMRRGQSIHAYVIRSWFNLNLIVAAALVSMYSQCGDPESAFLVFDSLEKRNVVLWTSMIEGYAMNGKFNSALKLFREMQDSGSKPNYVTLVVILSACSHGGLVDDGLKIFKLMRDEFGIEPQLEHYACVVDMLGRAGKLNEAEEFIESMSLKPSASMFGSLLGACQVYRDVKLGERMADKLFELEPNNAANYVILSNVYAAVGRWDDVGRVRELMVVKGLSKNPGCSWIEIKDTIYTFGAHDRSHSDSQAIYKVLEKLSELIFKAGYVPSTEFVLLDVDEDDKKRLLCSHSERLAIAFGLMRAPHGVPIRIAKNLRVCGDCHDAIKLISKVTSRDLIIRDTNRFHHFHQGSCSCGDYW